MRRTLGVLLVFTGSACFLGGAKVWAQSGPGYVCGSYTSVCGTYTNCYTSGQGFTCGGSTFYCMQQTNLIKGGCLQASGNCGYRTSNCLDQYWVQGSCCSGAPGCSVIRVVTHCP